MMILKNMEPDHEREKKHRVEASKKIHQLLLNYPGGIDLSELLSIFSRRYPHLSSHDVKAFLETTEGAIVEFKKSEDGGATFAYPLRFEQLCNDKIYNRELLSDGDGEKTIAVQIIHVTSLGAFFVYLPGQEERLQELKIEMSNAYTPGLPAERVEVGRHYAFAEDRITYKRVRVDYVKDPEQLDATPGMWQGGPNVKDVHCTLIDYGGEVDLSSEELMQLPVHLNPDSALEGPYVKAQLEFYPFATKCILPLNVNKYPLCRAQLYHALTGFCSVDKQVMRPFPVVKVKFMSYSEEACGFIAVPLADDGSALLPRQFEMFKKATGNIPETTMVHMFD